MVKKVENIGVGDYVGLLDSKEKGHVISIRNGVALVLTREGFEIFHPLSQLVKYVFKDFPDEPDLPPVQQTPPQEKEVIKNRPAPEKKTSNDQFPAEKKPVIKKVTDKNFTIPLSYLGEEKKKISTKAHKSPKWEIDLHIEELVDKYHHLTNTEILEIQLRHVKLIIDRAVKHKMSRVIFIHGKGKGVLREGLLSVLHGYPWLEYFDASLKEYGGGATEIKIYLNKAR